MYLGLDAGSTSIKAVLIDDDCNIVNSRYIRNFGIIPSTQEILKMFKGDSVKGIGITGSGRNFLNVLLDADLVKNEVIAHTRATMHYVPDVKTIFELGGEDAFICQLEENVITNIKLNNLCMGGTGSMVEAIGKKLGVEVEDIGSLALTSKNRISVASKCGLFAQSTSINKRNAGYPVEDILMAVCRGMVDNYFAILIGNSRLEPPYVLQGAVAKNKAIVRAFEEVVEQEVIVPKIAALMGAYGMSLFMQDINIDNPKSIDMNHDYQTKVRIGTNCGNKCEIIDIIKDDKVLGCIGNRCEKCMAQVQRPGPLCQMGQKAHENIIDIIP